ncbi:SURF1 family protein [Ahniella affigens]|nr:SURF1 family protein [Ahniella affigens]
MLRKPALKSWLLLVVGLTIFLSAANWQYGRAQYKDQLAREFAAALAVRDAPTLDAALAAPLPGAYQTVHLRGQFDQAHLLLLDNQVQDGRVGVQVFAPLQTDTGRHVLVQLGWVAWPNREQPVAIPPIPANFDSVGILAPPPAPGVIADSVGQGPYPRVLMSVEPASVAETLGYSVLSQVFWPKADASSGFQRAWHPPGIGAERHRGYALQWFSFAIAAIILFLYLHRPSTRD